MDARGRHYVAHFSLIGLRDLEIRWQRAGSEGECPTRDRVFDVTRGGPPLVGDVADVIRIEALRSTPLIVDGSTKAIPTLV